MNPTNEMIYAQAHVSVQNLLDFFKYEHLPEFLQSFSQPLHDMAYDMALRLEGPELTVGLRKLLEAKDCFVRAAL